MNKYTLTNKPTDARATKKLYGAWVALNKVGWTNGHGVIVTPLKLQK